MGLALLVCAVVAGSCSLDSTGPRNGESGFEGRYSEDTLEEQNLDLPHIDPPFLGGLFQGHGFTAIARFDRRTGFAFSGLGRDVPVLDRAGLGSPALPESEGPRPAAFWSVPALVERNRERSERVVLYAVRYGYDTSSGAPGLELALYEYRWTSGGEVVCTSGETWRVPGVSPVDDIGLVLEPSAGLRVALLDVERGQLRILTSAGELVSSYPLALAGLGVIDDLVLEMRPGEGRAVRCLIGASEALNSIFPPTDRLVSVDIPFEDLLTESKR